MAGLGRSGCVQASEHEGKHRDEDYARREQRAGATAEREEHESRRGDDQYGRGPLVVPGREVAAHPPEVVRDGAR